MARKPIPENLKVLKGTFRPDRAVPNAVHAVEGDMIAPEYLSRGAKRYFELLKERIRPLGLISPTYTEALAIAAMRMQEIDDLTVAINAEGFVIHNMSRDGSETSKSNPAVKSRSDALRHLQSLFADFGLNPSAIQKVGVKSKKDGNPFEAFG